MLQLRRMRHATVTLKEFREQISRHACGGGTNETEAGCGGGGIWYSGQLARGLLWQEKSDGGGAS